MWSEWERCCAHNGESNLIYALKVLPAVFQKESGFERWSLQVESGGRRIKYNGRDVENQDDAIENETNCSSRKEGESRRRRDGASSTRSDEPGGGEAEPSANKWVDGKGAQSRRGEEDDDGRVGLRVFLWLSQHHTASVISPSRRPRASAIGWSAWLTPVHAWSNQSRRARVVERSGEDTYDKERFGPRVRD